MSDSVRLAAIGDVHVAAWTDLAADWVDLGRDADALLLAGDLTKCGELEEARVVARAVEAAAVPVVAVLGNHDVHAGLGGEVVRVLRDAGTIVLEGSGCCLDLHGVQVGIAGVKGFGGGFPGATCSEFGEGEMKAFARAGRRAAAQLHVALQSVRPRSDVLVALTHYAPCTDTLIGEPAGLFAFLGSYELGEVIDDVGADVAIHGHAHSGTVRGRTPGGVPVRNVARPLVRAPYVLLEIGVPAPV